MQGVRVAICENRSGAQRGVVGMREGVPSKQSSRSVTRGARQRLGYMQEELL
jgi:hypothetical protein